MNYQRQYDQEVIVTTTELGKVWWYFLLRGLFAGILGLCALIWPTISLSILLALLGIYCLIDGGASLIATIKSGIHGLLTFQAGLEIALGVILLLWPGASIRVLLVFIGAWLLFSGISQIVTARNLLLLPPEQNLLTGIGITAALFGLVLVFWPGSGVVAIAWTIAAAALLVAVLLISFALRIKRVADWK